MPRSVGPVAAFGKAPVGFAGTAAGGKVDCTNITGAVIGETLTLGPYVFLWQLSGVPALGPGQRSIELNGVSPSDALFTSFTALGIGLVLGIEDAYIIDLAAPTVGTAWNLTLSSSTGLIVVQGMDGGQNATSGGTFPWPERLH